MAIDEHTIYDAGAWHRCLSHDDYQDHGFINSEASFRNAVHTHRINRDEFWSRKLLERYVIERLSGE